MIRDLVNAGNQTCEADVLVIGAGTAGLLVATHIAKKGLKVVVLESGGMKQDEDEHPLNEAVFLRSEYTGAIEGRFRCLGGTSTRWGGALIPFMAKDMDPQLWPISHAELLQYIPTIESFFGLPHGPYELLSVPEGKSNDHLARMAKWPTFSKRNVATLVSSEIHGDHGPTIWLNATAVKFQLAGSQLTAVTAQSPDNSFIVVHAKEIVFAAGAIESTRLLLLMDKQNNSSIFAQDNQLGRYFYDHISVAVANLDVLDRKALNRLVGFRFEAGGAMRNLRFELSESTAVRDRIPPCFAHISFEERETGGFDALRDFFRYIQQRQIPTFAIFLRLFVSTPWLLRAIWWRFFEKRLLYPKNADIRVHMVVEQVPQYENRITLSGSEMDVYGTPLPVIDWCVGEQDMENLQNATDVFQRTWDTSNLADIARFIRRPEREIVAELAHGGGIYHPGGSTRMGRTAADSVVDQDLRLFRLPNVSVVSTSVLPNGGGANPTMMLLMLASRCADSVAKKLGTPP